MTTCGRQTSWILIETHPGVLIPKTTFKVTHKTSELRGTDNDMSNKHILDVTFSNLRTQVKN